MASFVAHTKPLASLCIISRDACVIMSSMILSFYSCLNSDTSKLKADSTFFTIADGIVQNLLSNHLYVNKFSNIVGEEDVNVNISKRPYTVDNLMVPEEFYDLIDSTRSGIKILSDQIDNSAYKELNVFIDPIDGTREFATGLGEQCSICIGFSDLLGKPVAGLVHRPIPQPNSWAMGASGEGFSDSSLDLPILPNPRGFLTSNGGISKFVVQLMANLDFERVPSGGAGNKVLMLLEGKGACYIQDRGVSRWDTCAAQAILEAHGGTLSKLSRLIDHGELSSYVYSPSATNLDFEPGVPLLTRYNAVDPAVIKSDELSHASSATSVKPYANLCGLFALDRVSMARKEDFIAAVRRTHAIFPASYD